MSIRRRATFSGSARNEFVDVLIEIADVVIEVEVFHWTKLPEAGCTGAYSSWWK